MFRDNFSLTQGLRALSNFCRPCHRHYGHARTAPAVPETDAVSFWQNQGSRYCCTRPIAVSSPRKRYKRSSRSKRVEIDLSNCCSVSVDRSRRVLFLGGEFLKTYIWSAQTNFLGPKFLSDRNFRDRSIMRTTTFSTGGSKVTAPARSKYAEACVLPRIDTVCYAILGTGRCRALKTTRYNGSRPGSYCSKQAKVLW